MKSIILATFTTILISISSGANAQSMVSKVIDGAASLVKKSGFEGNGQLVSIEDQARIYNDARSSGNGQAVTGVNAIAQQGNRNAIGAVTIQAAVVSDSAQVYNKANASGGQAVAGLNAVAQK